MKRLSALLFALLLFLAGCASTAKLPDPPAKDVIQSDVQTYIQSIVDENATIGNFFLEESEQDQKASTTVVTCVAIYESETARYVDQFSVSYIAKDGQWEQETISINSDYEGRVHEEKAGLSAEDSQTDQTQDSSEETPDTTPGGNAASTGTVSDTLEDFMFYLEGKVYQLPFPYQDFKALGWNIKESSYDPVYETTELSAYSYCTCTLTNGSVEIDVAIINLSGNVKEVKDCNIGGITIEAKDNLDFYIAKGIHCLSTQEEISDSFGVSNQMSTYDDSVYLTYEFDTYQKARFCLYTNTTYNSIELRNFVATAGDETQISDERPDYLDSYVAPTSLGTDPTQPRFSLDGVLYQLPCPISEFLEQGWEITYNSVGSLGGGNTSYGVKLEKDSNSFYVTVTNFGKVQVAVENCAVTEVEFASYQFKNCPDDFLQLPGGLHMNATKEMVESTCTGFEKDVNENYQTTRYEYEASDGDLEIEFYFDDDPDYLSRTITIANKIWPSS